MTARYVLTVWLAATLAGLAAFPVASLLASCGGGIYVANAKEVCEPACHDASAMCGINSTAVQCAPDIRLLDLNCEEEHATNACGAEWVVYCCSHHD